MKDIITVIEKLVENVENFRGEFPDTFVIGYIQAIDDLIALVKEENK